MTWSDAARAAAAAARKRNAAGSSKGKASGPFSSGTAKQQLHKKLATPGLQHQEPWSGPGGGPGAKKAAANKRRAAKGKQVPGGFFGGPGSLTPNQRKARRSK